MTAPLRRQPGQRGPVKPRGAPVPDERLTYHGSPHQRALLRHGMQARRWRYLRDTLAWTRGTNADGRSPGDTRTWVPRAPRGRAGRGGR